MGKINRVKEPAFKDIEKLTIPVAEKIKLNNGIPLFILKSGTQQMVRVEFVFKAGKWFEPDVLVATSTNTMLNEGTKKNNSQKLATVFDYFGSYIQLYSENDRAGIVLYTLSKYFHDSIHLVADILYNSTFPTRELNIYLKNAKQEFLVNQSRVSFLARQAFLESLFGQIHPYGRKTETEDFEKVNRDALIMYYNKYYRSSNLEILVSGNWNFDIKEVLNQLFGVKSSTSEVIHQPELIYPEKKEQDKRIIVEKSEAIQSSIRIGKQSINRRHTDFIALRFLTTVLGGYFGSRLMKNIREDKGYTYGISAQLISLEQEGYFVISSDVGSEVCHKAIDQVHLEIKKIKEHQAETKEIELVRNYVLGNWLRIFDGPMATAESYRLLIDYGFDISYFEKALDTIRNITPEQLIVLANRYFQEDSFNEVIAGKVSNN